MKPAVTTGPVVPTREDMLAQLTKVFLAMSTSQLQDVRAQCYAKRGMRKRNVRVNGGGPYTANEVINCIRDAGIE